MSPRERVLAALAFRKPDVVPLEYHSSSAGFYEHGERLRELWARWPDDFGPAGRFQLCAPAPECVDGEDRYSEIRRDEWGALAGFRTPSVSDSTGPAFSDERAREPADTLVEHHAASIRYLIARGVDAIQFVDDFGTQCDLMLSPRPGGPSSSRGVRR